MSDLIDKFIILCLILILPINILISSKIKVRQQEKLESQLEAESNQKIAEALAEIKNQPVAQAEKKISPITIDSVDYATDSGKLIIEGQAPTSDVKIMVYSTLTNFSQSKRTKSSSDSASLENYTEVLGDNVEVSAVDANDQNRFTFIKKVDFKKTKEIEIRLEQNDSSATIKYDLENKKRII